MQSSSYYQGSEKETASKSMEGEGATHIVTHSLAPRDTAEHIDDTDGDESQSLLETGEQVTMPLDYQSLMPDQVNELQKLLHEFPQLTSDKVGCADVLEHDVIVGDAPPIM